MAEGVVNGAEVIQIEHQQAEGMPASLGARYLLVQADPHRSTVKQIGEAITRGQRQRVLMEIGVPQRDRRLGGEDGQHVAIRLAGGRGDAGDQEKPDNPRSIMLQEYADFSTAGAYGALGNRKLNWAWDGGIRRSKGKAPQ